MAYAALLSVTHILEQTLDRDSPYLLLSEIQQIASLLEKFRFFLNFFDNSSKRSSETIQCLKGQLRDAVYEVANTIESHVTNRVLDASTSHKGESFLTFFHILEKLIEELDSIRKGMEKMLEKNDVQDLHPRILAPFDSSKPASSGKTNIAGLDNEILKIKERLTSGSSNIETVPLVGMGGIGKTTLAREIYEDDYIVYHFHIRAWVTVTQSYNEQDILICLLDSMKKLTHRMHEESCEQLSEHLYKNLKCRRYFIVMDDVWDTKVWDYVKRLFPNDKNGSRIMLTTRLEKVAANANLSSPPHHIRFLDEDESWNLFCNKVFGRDSCPSELEKTGKKIVQKCQGLPLAIVVIAGLLLKARKKKEIWNYVEENLSSVLASNDEQFLKLWVVEGLLKPVESKSLEDIAEEYLFDLVERNLVLVCKQSSKGKIKTCKLHDLLRDICMREVERGKFFHITNRHLHGISKGIGLERLSIHSQGERHIADSLPNFLLRSLLNFDRKFILQENFINLRLLRVFDMGDYSVVKLSILTELVNLRFLACCCNSEILIASLHKFRHLQTLFLYETMRFRCLEPGIWNMPQLKHVRFKKEFLPDISSAGTEEENSVTVLEQLETLSTIYSFHCTQEILKRIPNIKKLGICYEESEPQDWGIYCLNNLVHLHKLESLKCTFWRPSPCFFKNIIFPTSLQKLTVSGGKLRWEDMTVVGLLPNLHVLKLRHQAFHGPDWEPTEGEFLLLKFLLLEKINLKSWRADNVHFPSLQRLELEKCQILNGIPSSIGEIPTLRSIQVISCCDSVVTSAMEIQEEQHSSGNDGLQVQIIRN